MFLTLSFFSYCIDRVLIGPPYDTYRCVCFVSFNPGENTNEQLCRRSIYLPRLAIHSPGFGEHEINQLNPLYLYLGPV